MRRLLTFAAATLLLGSVAIAQEMRQPPTPPAFPNPPPPASAPQQPQQVQQTPLERVALTKYMQALDENLNLNTQLIVVREQLQKAEAEIAALRAAQPAVDKKPDAAKKP